MSFCIKCGNQLKPNARFCGKCGEIIIQTVQQHPTLTAFPLCGFCGSVISPGVKFCTICGTPVSVSYQSTPQKMSQTLSDPLPNQVNSSRQQLVQKGPQKKRSKVFSLVVSIIVTFCIIAAGLYFFGVYKPNNADTIMALYQNEKYDQVKIDSAANVVENIFATSDTARLAKILSSNSLKKYRQYFAELKPHMSAFASDFKARKLRYATARLAVYEFSSKDGKFTAEFCLGDNGKWLLMRF